MANKNRTSINQPFNISLSPHQQWIIEKETDEYVILSKSKVTIEGHLIISVLFGWWLIFIPNLIYHLVMKEKIKILKNLNN